MMDLLDKVATTALLGFVVSSTLGMGAGLTVGQIVGALRDARLVLLALLANFALVPLGALALAIVLRLDEPLERACCLSARRPVRRFSRNWPNSPRATCPLPSARWCC